VTIRNTAMHEHDHVHADGSHHHRHGGATVRRGETKPIDGPVMLDIGGDIGAVIARLDDDLEGTELPILSLDDPDWDPHTHTGVWRRHLGNTTAVVAVYPQLPAGGYQLTLADGRTLELDVVGSEVNTLDLRTI
jgi:hypothetical protein